MLEHHKDSGFSVYLQTLVFNLNIINIKIKKGESPYRHFGLETGETKAETAWEYLR